MKCLYCSKKLVWVCDTTYRVDETRAPRVCGAHLYRFEDGAKMRTSCKSRRFSKTDDGWKCKECNAIHSGRRQITKRVHRYDKPGPNGDGLFCSKTHGWRFGILAARAGYKRKA